MSNICLKRKVFFWCAFKVMRHIDLILFMKISSHNRVAAGASLWPPSNKSPFHNPVCGISAFVWTIYKNSMG